MRSGMLGLSGKPPLLFFLSPREKVIGWDTVLILLLRKKRVLESVKAGRRLPEARFAPLKMASQAQRSVLGVFEKAPAEKGGG